MRSSRALGGEHPGPPALSRHYFTRPLAGGVWNAAQARPVDVCGQGLGRTMKRRPQADAMVASFQVELGCVAEVWGIAVING